MSKVSFRARALDSNRPLQLHFDHEITDLSDYASISRAVPLLPTGMEKEEETEHHLQEALFAQQQFKSTDLHAIPIPEIDENANRFKSLYHGLCREGTFRLPKHYIRVQTFALDPADNEVPEYDLDSEDEAWLSASRLDLPEVELERMLEQLERHSDHTVVSLREAKSLLRQDDGLTTAVYDYWLAKRLKHGHRLSLTLKPERRDGSSTNDPYVAFRRRTEKMQTRKHRKNDEASYEKMLKLRKDMERACSLMELLVRREESKQALLDTELALFQRRWTARDFDGAQLRAAAKTATVASARKSATPAPAAAGVPAAETNHHQHHNHHNHGHHHHQQSLQQRHHQHTAKRARKQPPPLPAPSDKDYGLLSSDEDYSPAAAGQTAASAGRYVWCRRRFGSVYAPARPLVAVPADLPPDPHRRQFSLARLPCLPASSGLFHPRPRPGLFHPRPRPGLTAYVGLRVGRGGRLLLDRLSAPEFDPYLTDWEAARLAATSPPPVACAHSGEQLVEEDTLFEHRLPAYELCNLPHQQRQLLPPASGEG